MDIVSINYMVAFCVSVAVFFIWMFFYPENLNFLLNRISGNNDYVANEFQKTKQDAILATFLPYAQKMSAKNHKKINKDILRKLDEELEGAGRPLNMEAIDYYNMRFVASGMLLVIGTFVGLMSDFGPSVGLGTAFVGFILPQQTIKRITQDRIKTAEMELPDILNLLSVCMGAGMTITKAMDIICKRPESLAVKVGIVLESYLNRYFIQ